MNNIGPMQKVGRVVTAAAVCILIAPIALFNYIRHCSDTPEEREEREERDARVKWAHNNAVMQVMTDDDISECLRILYAEGVVLGSTAEDAEANTGKIVAVFERD